MSEQLAVIAHSRQPPPFSPQLPEKSQPPGPLTELVMVLPVLVTLFVLLDELTALSTLELMFDALDWEQLEVA